MLSAPTRTAAADVADTGLATAELVIGGMHCSACATRIERTLAKVPSVASASVNLATNRAFVAYDAAATAADELCDAVAGIGYRAELAEPGATGTRPDQRSDYWTGRALGSWPLALAGLLVSLLAAETPAEGWTVLALAASVELIGGWPFLRNTVRLARHGATNMDTLITLGTLAALAVSAVEAIALGGRHLHLGGSGAFAARLHGVMAPIIVSILVTGRAIEAHVRDRAALAMRSLLSLCPPTARLVRDADDEHGELVAPESVPVGALVRVRPDEALPLDGIVVAGRSAIDESMLTGEPLPVERGPGSTVTGGTRNGSGVLVVEVTAAAGQSVLAQLEQLVEEAQQQKAPLQRLADRISAVFVPSVIAAATVTFLAWWLAVGNVGEAVLSAVAVLLVACPCAMGLAAPVAVMVGTGRASALGVFIRSGTALEQLAKVDTVAFDKTGTLTARHGVVTEVAAVDGHDRTDVLALAAAVEVESDHPIAKAIVAAAPAVAAADDVEARPGVGVEGNVGGRLVAVGKLDGSPPPGLEATVDASLGRGETVVEVRCDGRPIGVVAVTTPLRDEARPAIDELAAMGLHTTIISGDAEPAVRTVAGKLGIGDYHAALSPAGKVETLRDLQRHHRRVVVVGDGVNDAPALAAADVGCAIGSGSEIALAHSDVALLGNDLGGVPTSIGVAANTYSVILQNFGWAMGYNVSALPLAAFGLLDPLVAALAMGVSSLVVVLNSLRLLRLGRVDGGRVRLPRTMRGARGVVLSVAVPVVLFAGLTVVSQQLSPAKGQSLLPELPTITVVNLRGGGSAEFYADPGRPGANELHLIVDVSAREDATESAQVLAGRVGEAPQLLRQLRIAPGHFVDFALLTSGRWRFDIAVTSGGRRSSFEVSRVIP